MNPSTFDDDDDHYSDDDDDDHYSDDDDDDHYSDDDDDDHYSDNDDDDDDDDHPSDDDDDDDDDDHHSDDDVVDEKNENDNESLESEESAHEDALADMPIKISVGIGNREMSMKDLRCLAPGNIIDLGQKPDDICSIIANKKKIGEGKLASVGGVIGVIITKWYEDD
jgi:flagellar motor switch/type III secretory pathway protein FliN